MIDQFGQTAEPEFPGHVILEQYQAQVRSGKMRSDDIAMIMM